MDIFDQLESAWGKPLIPRPKVGEASGFAITPKSCANLDSLGLGCPERITVNGKVCYPAKSFFSWLRARSKRIQ